MRKSKIVFLVIMVMLAFLLTSNVTKALTISGDICIIPPCDGDGGSGAWNPGNYDETGLPNATIGGIISEATKWILGVFGFIGIVGFVISGILYLTAAGDPEQEKKAKKALVMSITGVVVGLIGLVVIWWVDSLLSASPL